MISTYTFDELTVGQKADFNTLITPELVSKFAEVSGDINPLHTDAVYAAETEFEKPIAHGMLSGALISKLIGMHLPGKYALYLSQNLTFYKPIFAGTNINVAGEIIQKTDAFKMCRIKITVSSEDGSVVHVGGEAMVKLLK